MIEEMGKCDRCNKMLPIERGENFRWKENTKEWLCYSCYEEEN